MRALFKKAKMVDALQPEAEFKQQCGNPKYIVTGTNIADRYGMWPGKESETVDFPNEQWHKCCQFEGKDE